MLSIQNVRCEYQQQPLGIDCQKPRLCWELSSTRRSMVQNAYQIQVSLDSNFTSILADSRRIESSESIHVNMPHFEATPTTRYYYRVKVWSEDEESDWEKDLWFETGLQSESNWQAEWITIPPSAIHPDQSPRFRKSFTYELPNIKSARLYTTAAGLYEARLNGARISDTYFAPGWTNYNDRIQYQTYDVTDFIRNGENVLAFTLGKGWYRSNLGWEDKIDIYGKESALLAELHIINDNNEQTIIRSDTTWKAGISPILSSEIYHGETYDARLEQPGWDEPEFSLDDWVSVIHAEKPKGRIVSQENEPVRKQEHLTPIEIIRTPKGQTVLDFGQNMVGWVHFRIQGKRGETVSLRHFEVLDADGNVYVDNLRKAKQTVSYTLKGDDKEEFEPFFSFQGFQYVELIDFPGQVQLEDFTGIVLHSDMQRIGTFECSDELINQLQHNIVWGQKGNFLDVPTDCPQRDERLGWTGDAQMFISTASYLYNVVPFFKKWLRDLSSEQGEDGSVPFVIPHVLNETSHSSAAWGDAAVICPWVLYENYGDKRILEEQFGSMKAWVNYIHQQGDDPYLWNTGFHFGDWLALDSKPGSYIGATERDFIATAFYAYSAKLVSKAAHVLGLEADHHHYKKLHSQVQDAFSNEFITTNGRLAVPTQTAHILALNFDLVTGKTRERTEQKLKQLMSDANYHLKTGFVGTPYLNFALTKAGHTDIAYTLLFQDDYPSWLYQVKKGATTVWEHWDGIKEDGGFWSADMNSFNHYAYGSIGDWLYRKVAGIDCDKPGYQRIRFEPHFTNELRWVKASLHTLYGQVTSAWKMDEDGRVKWSIDIPPNTTGLVQFPVVSAVNVREGSTQLADIEGLLQLEDVTAELGSGSYTFNFEPTNISTKLHKKAVKY
ncbi:alpha-L-rhamnosidase [Alkalicoccobacillus murimartini]|uniref:alpha-L-rhamnosidase n=1 Tax=Alkalicoccobacillus murimartini TaxID=171685 RepID=A0ABT9YJS0_9BACI|nr:alpha-L-rhamnosidase [Alkalicoccobacillus murimartini]MDQ0207462.1 alpha-L-rhamnosidase [Alkalicoccobacillus murimartini]